MRPRRKSARKGAANKARRGAYPVARPYAPPPQVPTPASPPPDLSFAEFPQLLPEPPRRLPPPSSRKKPLGAPAVTFLLVLLGVSSTATGWFLFHGPRENSKDASVQAAAAGEKVAQIEKPPVQSAKLSDPKAPPGIPPTKPETVQPVLPPEKQQPPKPATPPAGLTFEKSVLPIFTAKCVGCHGGQKTKGDLDLRTLAALLKGGENGPSIKPGSLDGPLWEAISGGRMPPGKNTKLTQTEKSTISKWLTDGAKSEGPATAAQAR